MADDLRIAAGVNTDGQVELTIHGDPSHTMNLEIEDARKVRNALNVSIRALESSSETIGSEGGDDAE